MEDDELKRIAERNLKYLDDIKKYNETHEKDFKQVFFKLDPNYIKSSQVGIFSKDIYGNEQVNPVRTIPGYHTEQSCKMNTAVYANTAIDYNSTNYTPGVKIDKVEGDFNNSPNYFLNATKITTQDKIFSVEMTGYIVAEKSGNYKVSNQITAFPKNVLIWVGNNSLKTYRKENALFVVENGVKNKNDSFAMVVGEYTPFRIQYSGNVSLDHTKLWANGDNYVITTFATSKNENNMYYYSLESSDKTNLYNCSIYKSSELEKYKTDAKQQVKIVWQKQLDENTEHIFLDMVGNLYAYNSAYEKIGEPLFQTQPAKRATYCKLRLYQKKIQPLSIIRSTTETPLITIEDIDTIRNQEWEKSPNPMVAQMTNKEEQIGDKRVSIQRITETNPLFSYNFRYKLCIMRNAENKKTFALLASSSDKRKFYTTEPDLKMNKLFYVSTYPENKFLREVPKNLQRMGKKYSNYPDMYPLTPGDYNETAYSKTNPCVKQCNDNIGCNHFYRVENATGTKCLIPKSSETPITYLPKQPDSTYTSSILRTRNNVIKTGIAEKDEVYDKTKYISNGYTDTVQLRYSDYKVEKNVLAESDTPGPNGTAYIVELKNNISDTMNATRPISITNINNPMNAGKIESFTVIDRSLTKLDQIDNKLKTHATDQAKVNKNRIDISNNITSIDNTYSAMEQNPTKYDFARPAIYDLEKEDRSLSAALLKDNSIYEEEQNNLYMITTLTMATLLVSAILISK
jgi:hypothetical protein